MYETLRKTARRLEGELDVKLASYSRLCAGYESTSTTPDGIGSHQFATQTSQEITSLLQRLGEVNKSMEATITGNDNRQHTVARQRDILQDLTQEFKRLAMQVTQVWTPRCVMAVCIPGSFSTAAIEMLAALPEALCTWVEVVLWGGNPAAVTRTVHSHLSSSLNIRATQHSSLHSI